VHGRGEYCQSTHRSYHRDWCVVLDAMSGGISMSEHVFLKILTKNLAGKNDESRMAQQKRLSRLDRGIQVFRFLQNEYKMFSHRTKPPSPTEYLPSSRGDGRPPSSIPRRRCGRRPLTESGGSPPARTTSWRRPSPVPLQWPSVTGTRAGTS